MEANLRDYIERLFANAPRTRKADELKDEMRENLIEKYRDLVASGMSEADAYNEVVRSIGDISILFRELGDEAPAGAQTAQAAPAPKYVPGPSGSDSGGSKAVKIVAIVVAAIVLIVIAALIFGFNLIFNKNSVLSDVTSGVVDSVRDAVSGSVESGGTFSFGADDAGTGGVFSSDGVYNVPAEGVSSIKIDWINGGVDVLPYDGDNIRFTESRGGATIEDADALRYGVKNGRLTIQFCTPRSWSGIKNFLTFDWNSLVYPKQLIVWVPASKMNSVEELRIDSVSAGVRLNGLAPERLSVYAVSGDIGAAELSCGRIGLESVSGKISLADSAAYALFCNTTSGAVDLDNIACRDEIAAQTVSGNIGISMAVLPEELKADSVSGNVKLTLPADTGDGFTLRFDSVSGPFASDASAFSKSGKEYVYGNGAAEFEVETVSGGLAIYQAD